MTRSELIDRLAARHPQLTRKDCELAVNVILEGLSSTLERGSRIEVRGFGCFVLYYREPRTWHNPKTGATLMIPAKSVPHFKPGKELRERVNFSK